MVDENKFAIIQRGMLDVVKQGTARGAQIDSVEVGGKTGTAQNPHGENHALFMGYATYKGRSIAIACIIENGGYGGSWSAPIASLMMEKYLKGHISERKKPVEERMKAANLLNKVNENYVR